MIVIGTRGSKLALAQAHWVSDELSARGMANEIRILKTKGDIVQDRFDKIEGKGFFTKEIEDALLAGTIDLAVHCLKDLPTEETAGLTIAAITERENPYDVLVGAKLIAQKENGAPILNGLVIGTSSNRRVQGLAANNLKARFVPLRGNVPTRITKMEEGLADAIVLAKAGVNRLGLDLSHLHVVDCPPPILVPAPGQGALALQTRSTATMDLSHFHHQLTADCVAAERRVLNALQGGCQLPLGVLVLPAAAGFTMELFLGSVDGNAEPLTLSLSGSNPMDMAEEALAEIKRQRP